MEKLKDFLEKWQWASIEDADKTLTESEQKIWELMKKNQDLEKQLAEKDKLISVYDVEQGMLQCKIANLVVKEIKAEDFAIKQIQKAWDMFSKEYFANEKMETLGTRFLARLDQQIKELKGE